MAKTRDQEIFEAAMLELMSAAGIKSKSELARKSKKNLGYISTSFNSDSATTSLEWFGSLCRGLGYEPDVMLRLGRQVVETRERQAKQARIEKVRGKDDVEEFAEIAQAMGDEFVDALIQSLKARRRRAAG